MTLSRRWAQFNKAVGNRLAGPLFGRMPGFGLVLHTGRKSGREYRTPVKVFRHDGAYAITLPYGSGTDWVRNVCAAGGCDLRVRGKRVPVVQPEVVQDDGAVRIRRSLRIVLRMLRVTEIMILTPAPAAEGAQAARRREGKRDPEGSRL